MVRTIDAGEAVPGDILLTRDSGLLVELVGLAGVGKSTLSSALSQRAGNIRVAADLELRKKEHLPIFVSHAPLSLPQLLRWRRSSRWCTWDEFKAMVYLESWASVLKRQADGDDSVVLLDHGPIFKLATLNAFGPDSLNNPASGEWWLRLLRQWAFTIDMMIWLDAPTNILIERINGRGQRHAVKGKPETEATDFLMRYLMSYEQVLAKMATIRKPTLLKFDTSQAPVEQMVDEVLATLN